MNLTVGLLTLSNEHPESSYGQLVLVGPSGAAYGPLDVYPAREWGPEAEEFAAVFGWLQTAAQVVALEWKIEQNHGLRLCDEWFNRLEQFCLLGGETIGRIGSKFNCDMGGQGA